MTSLWQLKRFEARISLYKSLDCPLALAAAGMNQRFTRYPPVINYNLGWCNWITTISQQSQSSSDPLQWQACGIYLLVVSCALQGIWLRGFPLGIVKGISFLAILTLWQQWPLYAISALHCAAQLLISGIVLYMPPANERRCYIVTSSLIGWVHIQNKPSVCISDNIIISLENHKHIFGNKP